MDHFYPLIMAGGGGTRLWPLSRQHHPKQLLPLVEKRSMFRLAVDRLSPLALPDQIFVVAGEHLAEQLQQDSPQIPRANLIIEPFGQNSGPAVGLALLHIRRRDPDAIVAVLTADHYIADIERFHQALTLAAQWAVDGYILTLGITPSFPSTGYGYIKQDTLLASTRDFKVYRVACFTEKPEVECALQFLAEGSYSWNSGMFVATGKRLQQEYTRQQPHMSALLQNIEREIGSASYPTVLNELWPHMPKLSIDYAIMEGAERMAVIPVDIGWSDIGNWAALYDVSQRDVDGNISRGATQNRVLLDTRRTLVLSNRCVVTIGLDDIVIVDTDDALLVCRRDQTEQVRAAVEKLKSQGMNQFL